MTLSPDALQQQLNRLGPVRRYWLAYSGGLDSHVLLDLAVRAGLAEQGTLEAVHVHHGLQSEADDWAEHCQQQCTALAVHCRVIRVRVEGDGGEESNARDARYRVFESLLAANDVLLMAHHGDDQAETLLLRLMRGSGVRGLAAIPEQRPLGKGRLFRPLLGASREAIESYGRQRDLSWIEDPSNLNTDYDRNFLRHNLMPLLKGRWPSMTSVIGRTAQHCREADGLLQRLAALDLERCTAGPLTKGVVDCSRLMALDRASQINLLRYWCLLRGAPIPDAVQLNRVLDEVVVARPGSDPIVSWARVEVRRFQNGLYLKGTWSTPPAQRVPWDPSEPLVLAEGGLAVSLVERGGLRLPAGAAIEVGFRQGGERLTLTGRGGSRSLKKLLQQSAVPPWLRAWLPLIYLDGELAAVADLWVCSGFEADEGEPGWRVDWTPPGTLSKD